jgi:hypothetical protein
MTSATGTFTQNEAESKQAKTRPTVKRASQATRAATSLPPQQPRTTLAPHLKPPLPAKSVAKARSAFKKFSLSKFAGQSTPSNYVPAGETPTAVHRKIITHRMQKLSEVDTSNRAMTFALPAETIKTLLPSFNPDAATIDLSDVMNLIEKHMRGTEFYANGNPTLNRLALQSQVQQIISTVTQGVKK